MSASAHWSEDICRACGHEAVPRASDRCPICASRDIMRCLPASIVRTIKYVMGRTILVLVASLTLGFIVIPITARIIAALLG